MKGIMSRRMEVGFMVDVEGWLAGDQSEVLLLLERRL